MALTVNFEKGRPVVHSNGIIDVPVEVVLKEDVVEVKRQTMSRNADKNTDIETLASGNNGMIAEAQAIVDQYKQESAMLAGQKFNGLIALLEGGVTV